MKSIYGSCYMMIAFYNQTKMSISFIFYFYIYSRVLNPLFQISDFTSWANLTSQNKIIEVGLESERFEPSIYPLKTLRNVEIDKPFKCW